MFIVSKKLLAGVSAAALAASTPVLAETARTSNQNDVPHYSEQEIEEGWENTKDAVSDAAEDVSEATKATYEDIKDTINGRNTADISTVKIDQRMTAAGMIGQPVYNQNGERVAKVKDIILDHDGNAMMVVLADGGWTGLGKLAAFDYQVITRTDADGDVVAPLTEEMIDSAASFSYDRSESDTSVKVIPVNGYSVAELLDGKLVDPEGKTVAEIDNISFRRGEADRLVIGFDQILGLGGKQAAMDFSDPDLVQNNGKVSFKLSSAQAKQFEAYKKTTTN